MGDAAGSDPSGAKPPGRLRVAYDAVKATIREILGSTLEQAIVEFWKANQQAITYGVIAAVSTAILSIGGAAAGLGHWIAKLPPVVVEGSLGFLAILGSGAALIFNWRLRKLRSSIEAQPPAPQLPSQPVAPFPLAPPPTPQPNPPSDELARLLRRYSGVNKSFGKFATRNAECDKRLFDLLNVFISDDLDWQLFESRKVLMEQYDHEATRTRLKGVIKWGEDLKSHRLVAVSGALSAVDANLASIINDTASILTSYTGHTCAACLKLPVGKLKNVRDMADVEIGTRYRDETSTQNHHRRMFNKGTYRVARNTITNVIIADQKPFWGSDDLEALGRAYTNVRPEWREDYNATLGVGIAAHWPLSFPYWGVLCVDNLEGGLNSDESCKDFLFEVADRVSLMLYRYYVLNV